MLNAKGPLWDGNEVWLITAGGVTCSVPKKVYATMFSSLHPADAHFICIDLQGGGSRTSGEK